MKAIYCAILTLLIFTAPAFATVTVSSPSNGETVGSNVQFVASGTTSTCSRGVASMGIYINNNLKYQGNGTSLNKTLSLGAGYNRVVIQEWDYCGGSTTAAMTINVSNQSGVTVSSPVNNSTVGNPASFVASASTGCSKGVAAMGVYDNNSLVYKVSGAHMNTQLSLGGGTQRVVVQEWDNCGASSATPLTVTVGGAGKTVTNLQGVGGWDQWGELAPAYGICTSCSGVWWSMYQHQSAVSLSGNSTKYTIGGSTPYSDVLWSNKVMGQGTTLNMPDTNHTLIPSIHHFTYDAYVYVTNASVTQSLEFDVNMYLNGVGMEWGTQCNHLDGGVWDIWNNINAKWVSTGVACNLINNGWNHVTLQVQRQSNNDLLYQSITMNGHTYTLNRTEAPFPVPSGWYGVTVNYQMDGNHTQASYTTYLDKLNLTYY